MLTLNRKQPMRESGEFERQLFKLKRQQEEIDKIPVVTEDRDGNLIVTIDNEERKLKEV